MRSVSRIQDSTKSSSQSVRSLVTSFTHSCSRERERVRELHKCHTMLSTRTGRDGCNEIGMTNLHMKVFYSSSCTPHSESDDTFYSSQVH